MTRIGTATVILAIFPLLSLLSCGGGNGMSSSFMPPSQSPSPVAGLKQLSSDSFTNSQSQHATEVEPGMAASGSTLVTAFQVGRIYGGGAADIGFATSTDAGASWSNGLLPGITQFESGTYIAVSDPSVAYDQAHSVWIIASLAIASGTDIVVVSRSSDAHNWNNPITVSSTPDADKNWITCDNNSASPFFGHCYVEWDDPSKPANGLIWMSTSTDGGITWSAAANTADMAAGVGGQPVVGVNGVVIVPIQNSDGTQMIAFNSTDGGMTWSRTVMISTISDHAVAGNLRTSPLPSAAVDGAGSVYVVWQDCRFRANCSSNDIVMSTSSDGSNWSAPIGVPIDSVTSTVDHFIPAIAADPASSGGSAHLGLTYYFYPDATCTAATCQLNVGFISSSDGGNTWGTPSTLGGPMMLSWLPITSSGVMVGDYVATAYANGSPFGVFAVAQQNTGSEFNEAIFTTPHALPQTRSARRPAMNASATVTRRSDHPPRRFYDLDHEHPIPRRKQ
ncbi:MAG TPA: sialidase family protein [Terriglobales bacterium]|nr:sialidase family protein [Terriglobales bacterium]